MGFMPATVWLHRWVSMAAGIVLLAVVLSGVALIWQPEIHAMLHRDLFAGTERAAPVSEQRAVAAARRAYPDFVPADVIRDRGVYQVQDADYESQVHVDPGTGRVLGMYDGSKGAEAAVFGFLENLHLCGLSCEEYPGYVPFLAAEVPLIGHASFPLIGNEDLTWGGLILGLSALVLLFIAITGIVVWWPGIRRMARGFTVRRRKGSYALNYDLHKVVGIVAIPFLVMWAVTGASYEFTQVADIWYWAMPGGAPPEEEEFASTPVKGESVTMDEAKAIAQRALPGRDVTSVSVPDRSDPASAYNVWMQDGIDPYEHGGYPGDALVSVDRYSGEAAVTYGDPPDGRRLSQVLMDDWNYPIHAGVPVNGWWRTFWLVFGLTPLLLAVTGVVTWLMRRRRGRRGRGVSPAA
jgi:uncharacterized iron-regulated membrane protein